MSPLVTLRPSGPYRAGSGGVTPSPFTLTFLSKKSKPGPIGHSLHKLTLLCTHLGTFYDILCSFVQVLQATSVLVATFSSY